MSTPDNLTTDVRRCNHCGNKSYLKVLHHFSQMEKADDPDADYEHGWIFDLLLCPTCDGVILQRYFWSDLLDQDPEDVTIALEDLYPRTPALPQGLPPSIKRAYEAAHAVRRIDANAYAVLLGRTLEIVCEDRQAQGKDLAKKLSDLATRGEIPDKLVAVANGLRRFRNVGAHTALGELTASETPVLDQLTRAILEYVYTAPFLAERAERLYEKARKRKTVGPK